MDTWEKYHRMDINGLQAEISKLTKTRMMINPRSPMYNQIGSLISMAHAELSEKNMIESIGSTDDSEVLEFGKIEEEVYYPDYAHEDLLKAIVTQYTDKI